MGSLSASGIPVVQKQPYTFRKRDNFITQADNRDDSVSSIVTYKPDQNRPIGSGSIVRESGIVDYHEELVVGAYRMGRSSPDRIASATSGIDRVAVVDLAGGQTIAVIPPGATSGCMSVRHTGNKLVRGCSVDDTTYDKFCSDV